MFKSVRLKLTFINIAVVGIILLIFLSGIYLLMRQDMRRQSDQMLFSLIADTRAHPQRRIPDIPRNWAIGFYVKIDNNNNILDKSVNLSITENELKELIEKAMLRDRDGGVLTIGSEGYRYLRAYSIQKEQILIAFMSTQLENQILGRLKLILFSIGFSGILLVFFSSLFLAGRALIPIKKSWERQRDFVADASHELRSPLAVIQTNLELVMDNKEESVESQSKWLENIKTENKRMTTLVNNLLLLARADSDQKIIEKRIFPIHSIMEDVALLFQPLASSKKIELATNIKDSCDFFGDESRIKQLVVILLDNAIKYTQPGGRVCMEMILHENVIELAVSDTGVGIAEEHIEKIFERFYRVDKARSRENGGAGLGLSIANWIVKEHKGTINVSSTPEKGSTFRVILPKVLPKIKL